MKQNTSRQAPQISVIIGMLITFIIYASTGIFSKLASSYPFLSLQYLLFLTGAIATLGIYAILWQAILKRMPLNQAYLWKSSTIVISLIFAYFLFDENITIQNMLGSGCIILGITILSLKK